MRVGVVWQEDVGICDQHVVDVAVQIQRRDDRDVRPDDLPHAPRDLAITAGRAFDDKRAVQIKDHSIGFGGGNSGSDLVDYVIEGSPGDCTAGDRMAEGSRDHFEVGIGIDGFDRATDDRVRVGQPAHLITLVQPVGPELREVGRRLGERVGFVDDATDSDTNCHDSPG